MTKVTGITGKSVEQFKEGLPQSVAVFEKGGNFYVFSQQFRIVQSVKRNFPEATAEVVDSDQTIYDQAIKGQGDINLRVFKLKNPAAERAYCIITSSPKDAYSPEAGTKFADNVLQSAKFEEPIFGVRPWLKEAFDAKKYNNYIKRGPMPVPRTKAIDFKGFIAISDVPQLLSAVLKFDFLPIVLFAATNERKRRATTQRAYPTRSGARNSKPRGDSPRTGAPRTGGRPAKGGNEEVRIDIEGDSKPSQSSILVKLDGFPPSTAEKLLKSVENLVPNGHAKIQGRNILVSVSKSECEKAEAQLRRIKLNGAEVALSVRK